MKFITKINKFISRLKEQSNYLIIQNEKTFGIIESLLSAMIFFSFNFLMLIPQFQDKVYLFLIYNYIIIFLLTSAIANLKFNTNK